MSNNSLLQTITNMIDIIANKGTGCDNLINVLSLLCIHNILSRTQPSTAITLSQPSTTTDTTANPLNKILGELTKNTDKGGGGPSPDMLMSLLPLLNNPQIKSKLNPTNISAILGLLNNFGGGNNDKPEKPEKKEPPAAAITSSVAEQPTHAAIIDPYEQDTKDLGNSLNWKTNFQNEKEV